MNKCFALPYLKETLITILPTSVSWFLNYPFSNLFREKAITQQQPLPNGALSLEASDCWCYSRDHK